MSHFREKAEAQTSQMLGQVLGDELLVREGQARARHAAGEPRDQRHFQTGMPKPHPPRAGETDQDNIRDERGQEQPKDKERAQHVSRVDRGGDPPGKKS